jgi:energy-coupling factor transporter ATP-binding protein EcfA2
MRQQISRIKARNFRSLESVDVSLGQLNVLVGPNGSGKTNLLRVLEFLATTVRYDLSAALDDWRGFEHVQRQDQKPGTVRIVVEGQITQHSSWGAPDGYTLELEHGAKGILWPAARGPSRTSTGSDGAGPVSRRRCRSGCARRSARCCWGPTPQ